MPTSKRLRAPIIVMFGMVMAVVAFAGPANAADYPPTAPSVKVLGVSLNAGVPASSVPAKVAGTSTSVKVAGVGASAAPGGLAFTGTNAVGIGGLGGLLLLGGGLMLFTGRRRKVND
jgi:hypothetical protein